LIFTKHNKRKTAKLLGISERTLYRKLKDYGLD
ncbi:MAG: transcriptional regulator, partial [Bacteroidetes bacterium]|nr:transcriptional regulator [Bacteroidota bacterium]